MQGVPAIFGRNGDQLLDAEGSELGEAILSAIQVG